MLHYTHSMSYQSSINGHHIFCHSFKMRMFAQHWKARTACMLSIGFSLRYVMHTHWAFTICVIHIRLRIQILISMQ